MPFYRLDIYKVGQNLLNSREIVKEKESLGSPC